MRKFLHDHALLWPFLVLFVLGIGLHAVAEFVMANDEQYRWQDFVKDTSANLAWSALVSGLVFELVRRFPMRGAPGAKEPEEVDQEDKEET